MQMVQQCDRFESTEMLKADDCQLSDVASRYSGAFYRYAYRYLRSHEDAEDAVQEALLLAHSHFSQFRGNSRLSTWVMAIVINCAHTYIRQRALYRFVPIESQFDDEEVGTTVDLIAQDPNPEEIYADAEQRKQLFEALNRLPASLQKVYRMRDLEGKSTLQVSQALGISEGTVKGYLFRARMKLARSLVDTIRSSYCRPSPKATRRFI